MAYPKEIMDRAFEILEQRRSRARNEYQYHQQVIREKVPAVEELRRELTGTSAAIAKTILSGGDVEAKIARLRDTNLYMQQRKRELLREAGLPEDYDEMQFTCPICKDTGYAEGKMCRCMKEILSGLMLERLSRTANTTNITFETFSLDFYPGEPLPGVNYSARDVMRRHGKSAKPMPVPLHRTAGVCSSRGRPDWAKPICRWPLPARSSARGTMSSIHRPRPYWKRWNGSGFAGAKRITRWILSWIVIC